MAIINIKQVETVATPEIQRTNIFNGEFSPTGVESARCFRRIYLSKILGITPKQSKTALIFGSAIHAGVETFANLHDGKRDILEIKIASVKAFADVWQKAGTIGDVKRNLDTGILTMNRYCDTYQYDTSTFDKRDIESEQWMPMPNGTSLLVKVDRILNRGDLVCLVDTKTTSSALTEFFFRNFENSLQLSLYTYVIKMLLGHCDMIMVDAIKVPPPKSGSPTEGFARPTFFRTDMQLQDAVDTYMATTNYIMDALAGNRDRWERLFFCNQGECDKYAGCPYLPICKHGLDHPALRIDFNVNTPEETTI
jgi:hypothetical protein